jgi:hypothetical protein
VLVAAALASFPPSVHAAPRASVRIVPMEPPAASAPHEAPSGTCIQSFSTYSSFQFDAGGPLTVQAGMAETEIAAASYILPAADFPVRLDRAEMAWGTNAATIPTTTRWSLLVWQGIPSTGTLLITVSSDGISIPHLVLPSGTNAVVIQVDFLPDPPDNIVITDNGTHTYSIGFRIDDHNQQTGNPCTVAPPTCCNGFPTTDTSGLSNSANNWLHGIDCGQFGCPPPNGGWARFSQLPVFCRPTGDWNLRATIFAPYATGEIVTLTCADTFDNDCDGLTDCDDPDCASDPVCTMVGVPGAGVEGRDALRVQVPNPFPAGGAAMRLHVPRAGVVRIDAFDLRGRFVLGIAERMYAAGDHVVEWGAGGAAGSLAPGTYFVRASAGEMESAVTKIVVVR